MHLRGCTYRPTRKMTAHDQMRAMLDQLMGTGRNGTYIISLLTSLRHVARGVSDNETSAGPS